MALITYDLQNLYQRQFGKKPVVPAEQASPEPEAFRVDGNKPNSLTSIGSALTAEYRGQEIWLPVKFFKLDPAVFGVSELLLPYAVISFSSKKNIIETPMAERQGTVKEQYSIEDTHISVKGFLIGYDKSGKYPVWPEEELKVLKNLYMLNEAIHIDNALINEWIGSEHKVVMKDLDLPAVEGGRKHIRPFSFNLVSDTIFTLELT